MRITVTASQEDIERAVKMLSPAKANAATRRALNVTLRNVTTQLSKRTGQRVRLKAGDIKAAMHQGKASGDDLQASVTVTFAGVALSRYPHRQTRTGVSVGILRGEGRKTIRTAFVNKGVGNNVFSRDKGAEKRRMTRGRYAGKLRQPISKLYGPSIRGVAAPILDDLDSSGWVADRLRINLTSEIDRALNPEARSRPAAKGAE